MLKKRKLRKVGLYVLSLFCVSGYGFLNNSNVLEMYIQEADACRADFGFEMFFWAGLLKYGLLFTGISIFCILQYLLFWNRNDN